MVRSFADSNTLIRGAIAAIVVVALVASVVFADFCELWPPVTNCNVACHDTQIGQNHYCEWTAGFEYFDCYPDEFGCWCEHTFSNEVILRKCQQLRKLLDEGKQCGGEYCMGGTVVGYSGDRIPNECTEGCY